MRHPVSSSATQKPFSDIFNQLEDNRRQELMIQFLKEFRSHLITIEDIKTFNLLGVTGCDFCTFKGENNTGTICTLWNKRGISCRLSRELEYSQDQSDPAAVWYWEAIPDDSIARTVPTDGDVGD